MSSHRPYYDDELGLLVRAALESRVEKQKPSRRVWRRIKMELRQSSRWRSNHIFSLSLSVVTQVALLVLLLTVGGLDIRYETAFRSELNRSNTLSDYVSRSALIATTADATIDSEVLILPVNPDEMRLLKSQSRINHLVSSTTASEPGTPPLAIPPVDVLPHTNSPEGRLLVVERKLSERLTEILTSLQVKDASGGMIK